MRKVTNILFPNEPPLCIHPHSSFDLSFFIHSFILSFKFEGRRLYADKCGNMASPPGTPNRANGQQKGQRSHEEFVKRLTVKEKACKAAYASTQNSSRGEAYGQQQQWRPAYPYAPLYGDKHE